MTNPAHPKVLLLGEGNFSFAIGLLRQSQISLVATCLENQEILEKNPTVCSRLRELESLGAQVICGVDATQLHRYFVGKFDRIIFNFPHLRGKAKIHLNRKLIRDFFHSASSFLANEGEILLSLCKGQGGTPVDAIREWGDSWQVVSQSAYAGLLLTRIHPFDDIRPPGYRPTGRRGNDLEFSLEGALTHVFAKEGNGNRCIYPIEWAHDISFWDKKESQESYNGVELSLREESTIAYHVWNEDLLKQLAIEVAGDDHVLSVCLIDEYIQPLTQRKSYCFRIVYLSYYSALDKEKANEIQLRLRRILENRYNVALR